MRCLTLQFSLYNVYYTTISETPHILLTCYTSAIIRRYGKNSVKKIQFVQENNQYSLVVGKTLSHSSVPRAA